MKNKVKALLIVLVVIMLAMIAYGTTVLVISPSTSYQNFSGTIVLNATTDFARGNITNVTFFFYDYTSGVLVYNVTAFNETSNDTIFNLSVDTTIFILDGKYNLTVNATNSTGKTNGTNSSITDIIIDNMGPNVTAVNSPAANANFSTGFQLFNATVNDTWLMVDAVVFNISNGSSYLIYATTRPGGPYWNTSINVSLLAEELHTLIVQANDTLGNTNKSLKVNFTVDRTGPNIYTIIAPVAFANLSSGFQLFNITVNDTLLRVDTVIYNITNGSGAPLQYTASNPGGDYWNLTINVSLLAEEVHVITLIANDTLNNVNNTVTFNFTVDRTDPDISAFTSPTNGSSQKTDFVINVTVSALRVRYRIENGSNSSDIKVNYTTMNNSGGNFWNATIGISSLGDWNYTIRFNVTDYAGNINDSQFLFIRIDDTNPSISSFSCNNIDLNADQSCTCTASDNSAAFGGSVSTSISSASTTSSGSKSVICTATDTAGNTATLDTTYTVTSSSGSGASGSGGGTSVGVQGQYEKKVWTSISKGETATVEVGNSAVGVTEVKFVAEKALYGAWVKVEKVDKLPSTVKPSTNKVYKLIEVTTGTSVKADSISGITIDFKVPKTWLAENKLDRENIVLLRYVDGEWKEMVTKVGAEEGDYVKFTAETPGFSYFAIAEKGVKAETAPVQQEQQPAAETPTIEQPAETKGETVVEEKSYIWAWVILAIVLVAALAYLVYEKKRR